MMKISSFHKTLCLALLAMLPVMGRADDVFRHYVGFANKAGDYEVIDSTADCFRQKTYVYHYYFPIPKGESSILTLPISNYNDPNRQGDPLEPRGYFRWYNYDTDYQSKNISIPTENEATTKLKEMTDSRGKSKGLVAYDIRVNATYKTVGVKYTRPNDDSWTGETVACDVSRYIDGCAADNFQHEPTLSIRYIFHILPAEKFADDMEQALLNGVGSKVNDLTYEDNKEISVGFKDTGSTMALRLNLNDYHHYYFHPVTNTTVTTHHVYYTNEKNKFLKSQFDEKTVLQANNIMWRFYNAGKTLCHTEWRGGRFFDISLSKLNGFSGWYTLDNQQVAASKNPKFGYGSRVYVVAYACANGNSKLCPIANFAITFYNHYPMTGSQLHVHSLNTRLVNYLDTHYRSVATISFDNDNDEMNLVAPTNPNDNQSRLPSKWSKRSYGFVYRDLIPQSAPGTDNSNHFHTQHSPVHGEFGLYKSANVRGISGAGMSYTNGYVWWTNNRLYDRTYEATNGAQYGHFLYIDAADESRQIAEADFKANLCAGSQVIFSAAIADMTAGGSNAVKPEVMFKLYGVHYDQNNNETDRKLLHSFSTGYLLGNTDDYNTGKWYQAYGKMILPKESGVNNYEDFKIVVDNYCKSTSGADYAFDDLRIYTKASKIDVLQSTPICPDVDTNKYPTAPATVKLKLRGLQENMTALAEHAKEKKLYYRFMNADGTPATGVNYGTKEQPNTQWGVTTIYNEVDTTRQVDSKPMYETINDETYVTLANRYFNLKANQEYYLSLAFDNDSIQDKNLLEWGKPDDVCSLYSEHFQMVQQKVVVTNANGDIVTSVTIPCDENATPKYDIQAQLQTVDQNNGGSINLKGVLFNWYVDDEKEARVKNSAVFENIPLSPGVHTIHVRPVDNLESIEQGGVSYEICLDEMSFKLRVVKNGPGLTFGMDNVTYPANYPRTVRLGLPQVRALAQQEAQGKGGYFLIPVSGKSFVADNSTKLDFVEEAGKNEKDNAHLTKVMYLSATNDPWYTNRLGENLKLATLEHDYIARNSNYLGVKFMPQTNQAAADSSTDVQLHEGYWYEGILIYREDGTKGTTVLCAGESYLRFEVVPEYVTWTPTASNKMSAAWNNDQNWMRSTSQEIYKKSGYTDYVSPNAYVPMKFTKVTIPNLSGLYFPDLGYMAYQSGTGIAIKLSNPKGDAATTNIQYAMMAKWNAVRDDHDLTAEGNLACEPWYGNTCDQIYFKPGGELLDQCYLIYNKAWVEKEMKPNTWYALTSPLQDTYAGDMYVPKATGRQETEAFEPIRFSEADNNRVTSPVYQRSWDDKDAQEISLSELGDATQTSHPAYDYSGTDISFDEQNLTAVSANWSHVFNQVNKKYDAMKGFAIKMGDKYTTDATTPTVLMRLPKADQSYTYYNKAQSGSAITATIDKAHAYRLVVNEDQQENALGKMILPLVQFSNGNTYYLVGNPYMATMSMYKFIKANPAVSPTFYVYENGTLRLYDKKLDMSTSTYEPKNDVTIAPMQAFFIRLADGQTADQINFTSAMTIDREVKGGNQTRTLAATTRLLTLRATAQGYGSEARVVLSAGASADYDAQEDAQLLYDSNLKDVPTVYTVAGSQAVAVNSVPEIRWLPLGVMTEQSQPVTLSVKGAATLGSTLYLYDAATKQYQEIRDGEDLHIVANEHGRYFLTQTRNTTSIDEAERPDEQVKVFSPVAGMIVVSAIEPEIERVDVYTLDGKKVMSQNMGAATSVNLQVPSAYYIVKVHVSTLPEAITRKIAVR